MGNGNVSMIVLLVIFVAFMYFGMIRPQKKQQQKRQEMLSQLKKGDPIVTIGGLHGVIERVTNRVFLLSPASVEVQGDNTSGRRGSLYNQG